MARAEFKALPNSLSLYARSDFCQPLSESTSLMRMRCWAQVPHSLWGRPKWEKRFYAPLSLDPRVFSSSHAFCRVAFLSSFLLQRTLQHVSWNASLHTAGIRRQDSLGFSKLLAVHLAPGWLTCLQALNSGQLLHLSWGLQNKCALMRCPCG